MNFQTNHHHIQHHHHQHELINKLWEKPLLRIWYDYSGSQPKADGRMLARAPREELRSSKHRRDTLMSHADHSSWTETPYISFTSSPHALESIANKRQGNANRRGVQRVTVIDPFTRFRLGLPILDYGEEMHRYRVADPYNRGGSYYKDHYLCLSEVTPEEVVGTVTWEDLRRVPDWYNREVLPAWHAHRNAEQERFNTIARLRTTASDLFVASLDEYNTPNDALDNIVKFLFEDEGRRLDMYEIMVMALVRYMEGKDSEVPTDSSMESMLGLMEPYDIQTLTDVGKQMRNLTMSRNADAMERFFDEDLL